MKPPDVKAPITRAEFDTRRKEAAEVRAFAKRHQLSITSARRMWWKRTEIMATGTEAMKADWR